MGAGFCRLLDDVKASLNDPLTKLPKPAQYTRAEAIDLMVRGGFPEIRTLTDKDRLPRYRSYLDSIIEKDVPILAQVRKPDELRRFMYQLEARTGSELNSTCSKSAFRLMAKSPGGLSDCASPKEPLGPSCGIFRRFSRACIISVFAGPLLQQICNRLAFIPFCGFLAPSIESMSPEKSTHNRQAINLARHNEHDAWIGRPGCRFKHRLPRE
ncbi:MAG TPA: hypothetical protein VM659_08935 [Dongiaceae bacterium]|nr:hypothetical protein [Dongiaceae bacterium]